jgi:hypothetical protein
MLSVPLPLNKDFKLQIKYFPLTLEQKPKEFIISVGEFCSYSEIRQKLMDAVSGGSPTKNKQPPFIG